MTIEKDHIWEAFIGAETFEAFQKSLLHPIFLKPQVSDDIRHSLKTAEKLLRHSYFEYEFIDVALTHAIIAFEKALRVRWNEIHGKPTRNSFKVLIDWFYENNYFETWNKEMPHQLRQIRNNKAHDEKRSLGGIAFLQKVYSAIDLINDLYEDPTLRVQRKKEIDPLAVQLELLLKKGCILTYNDQRIIIFTGYPVFLDNKSSKKTLNVSFCPIFDLNPYKNGEHLIPKHVRFSASDWTMTDDEFAAMDTKNGKPIVISRISDDTTWNRFEIWQEEFYGSEKWPLILFLVTEPLNDYFIHALRKYHQQ